MPPDIQQFINMLRRHRGTYVPVAELGVHPTIRERFIGHLLLTLGDGVEFWYHAGSDYVKLQPAVDF